MWRVIEGDITKDKELRRYLDDSLHAEILNTFLLM